MGMGDRVGIGLGVGVGIGLGVRGGRLMLGVNVAVGLGRVAVQAAISKRTAAAIFIASHGTPQSRELRLH